MFAALAGALFAIGLLVLFDGLFPRRASLSERIARFDEEVTSETVGTSSLIDTWAMLLLETVKGEKLAVYESDVIVSGSTMLQAARDKGQTAVFGGGVFAGVAIVFGWISDPLGLLVSVALGAVLGYGVPDLDLKKKAAERRVEFARTLTAFMTLLSSSISGGGGLMTALDDASAMGTGWVFDHIRDSLASARLDGTSAWVALEQLGQRLQVVPLIELAGSLTLAGTSGARVTETLVARSQSSREKELAEVRSEAEAKSSKLGVPVGMIMMTWVFFIGYPAVRSIVGA